MARNEGDLPRLLILDDEAGILSSLRRALRREGYEILTFERVDDALRELELRAVDAILTDHKMPGMSGMTFLQSAAELRPEAARLLITGWPEAIPRSDLEELGIRALITKPWDDAKLKATLQAVLRPR